MHVLQHRVRIYRDDDPLLRPRPSAARERRRFIRNAGQFSRSLSLSLFLQCNTYTHMHTMLDEERVSRLCAAIVDRRLSRRLSRARGRGKVAAAGCDGECALFSADFIGTQHTCCRKLVRARICVCVVIGRRRVCVCRSCTG